MKTNVCKKMLSVVAVFLTTLTTHGENFNLTALSGNGGIDYYMYSNNRHDYFIINTGTFQPISIQFDVALHYSDVIKIYRVYDDGTEALNEQITGFTTCTVQTGLPTGRAKIEFISDASISYDYGQYPTLTGFSFYYSAQPYTFTNFIRTSGNASIAGNLGVGFSNPLTRLHINGPIRGDGPAGSLTVNTTYGNVTMGATSSTQATISTDRSYFQFDKSVYLSDGIVNATTSSLQLRTNNSSRLTILNSNGNVGIGTTLPSQKLTVIGNMALYPSGTTPNGSYNGSLMITQPTSSNQFINLVKGTTAWSIGVKGNNYAIGPGNTTDVSFTPSFVITPGGYIGIGTTSPDKSLTVNGTIHAKEVLVDYAIPFPDYVFDKKYTLRTLYDVDAFIKDKGHLPDIPSADDVEGKSINVADLQIRLLQKIEELTLYAVDQQKRLDEQQARIDALEKALTLERTK